MNHFENNIIGVSKSMKVNIDAMSDLGQSGSLIQERKPSVTIETGRPNFQRYNAAKFENSTKRFKNISPIMIFIQSLIHLCVSIKRFLCNPCTFCLCSCDEKEGQKGDKIELTHKDPITASDLDLFFGTSDVVSGAVIDPSDLESAPELTDKVFRNACNEAYLTCQSYAVWFKNLNKLTRIAEVFAIFVFPIAVFLDFKEKDYIVSICLIIPVVILNIMCEWSVLMEKYASIGDEFLKLANRKDENRIDEYETLVNRYRSCWLYSDSLIIKSF